MQVADVLRRHAIVALDANILIYVFQQNVIASPLESLFDAFEREATSGVIASFALTEILAGPARAGQDLLLDQIAEEIRALPSLQVRSLDPETAIEAGRLRADLSLADAIHVATAIRAGATAMITNDRRIRSRANLEVIQLSDLAA